MSILTHNGTIVQNDNDQFGVINQFLYTDLERL